jgi:phytoene synthase
MVDLAAAYASCARDASAHYENFPVASLLLPRRMRPHVAAVYAFARAADDFADEGDRSVEERHALLDLWQCRLREAASAPLEETRPATTGEPANAREIFIAIGATMRACRLEPALFEDLLSAFRQDVTVSRYSAWGDLFDYCRRSANPIGRLVLRIGGGSNETFDRWSDAICTALQLTNFWQDVVLDYRRGRIYMPLEEMRTHGAQEQSLAEGRITAEWERALASAARRTRMLFDEGRPLCDQVRGRLGWELRAMWLGGTRILDRLESVGFDVARRRPSIGATDLVRLGASLAAWPFAARRRVATP